MENTTVVIVCNGESVLQNENGDRIDNFDRVVRIGKYKVTGYEKYVGTREDICIIRDWQLIDNRCSEIWSPPAILKGERLLSNRTLTTLEYNDIKSQVDVEYPTTGILAYFMVKKYLPGSKIYYTGMDFLRGGWYWDPDHSHFNFTSNHRILHEPLKEQTWMLKAYHSQKVHYV